MKATLPACLAMAMAFCLSCGIISDYDIAEVASEEHLCEHDDHSEACHEETGLHMDDDAAGHDADDGGETETGMHLHQAGDRNHGTQWFFNQPWAAPFVWGKMLRDTCILLALSLLVVALSRRRIR